MFERLVVALDGSEVAERILPHVVALAKQFGSEVTLLQVTEAPETVMAEVAAAAEPPGAVAIDPMPIIEAERQGAAEYLAGIEARLRGDGLTVACAEPEGSPAAAIVDYAQEHRADLIAMTTHGRSGLGRLVFGSVADSVLRHAPCPVLLVRMEERGDDAGQGEQAVLGPANTQ